MSLTDGYNSLSNNINKVDETDDSGLVLLPELELSMTDDELISLQESWLKEWEPYSKKILSKQEDNENYWMGNQYNPGGEKRPLTDNLIFEALETFLPIATRPKADPQVESDNTEAGNAVADKVRKMLIYIADRVRYNLKMKQVTRYWALYMLGVVKVGWSMKENDITCVAVRPQKLILDHKATIEECEYDGHYIGEIMDDIASDLVIRFPKKEALIKEHVRDKMGTTVKYTMWTTDEYVFWTLNKDVLDKKKNPNWNYEAKPTMVTDNYGNQTLQDSKPKNHFNQPKKPYVFLSVFNLGRQPHDDTNLVQQNLPLQDLINKRLAQIDKNLDSANGGLIVSGDAFDEEQASGAALALRKGGTIWVPTGDVNTAVRRDSGVALPPQAYESLVDYRNELRNIFGTRGSSPQGTIAEQTLGGKQIVKGQDADRIGGGVSTYLEQFSDNVYNWFVQLMYVYYDEPHMASVMGKERTQEYITLTNTELVSKLMVGVKEGSMIPHDPANERAEAISLWAQQGIDPISFFTKLDFPNPRESAKSLYLWQSDPVQLFPELAQAQAQQQQAMQQQQMQQVQGQQDQQMQVEQQKQDASHQQDMQKIALKGLVDKYNQPKTTTK